MSEERELYPCVGVCIPDDDEAYCLGCGRPWGEPRPAPKTEVPESPQDETPPA